MAIDKNSVKEWFRTHNKPTQAQFWAWIEACRFSDEPISMADVEGLIPLINSLPTAADLANKVDKQVGKGLSTEDFTTILKEKLEGLQQLLDSQGLIKGEFIPPINVDVEQQQADWNEVDIESPAFIQNKPSIDDGYKMIFPHQGLTSSDVGKVVVWDGSHAILPTFTPYILPEKRIVDFQLARDVMVSFTPLSISLILHDNPQDGDGFDLVMPNFSTKPFSFKPSAGSGEIQIGANIEATVANMAQFVSDNLGEFFTADIAGSPVNDTLVIKEYVVPFNGLFANPSVFSITNMTGNFVTSTVPALTPSIQMGDCLAPLIFLDGLGLLDTSIENAFDNLYSTDTFFSRKVHGFGNKSYSTYYLPNGYSEVLDFFEYYLTRFYFFDSITMPNSMTFRFELYINEDVTFDGVIDVNENYSSFWGSWMEEEGDIVAEGVIGKLPITFFPILGVVKSVSDSTVELFSQDVVSVMAQETITDIEGNDPYIITQNFILDNENVGYLKSLIYITGFDLERYSVKTFFMLFKKNFYVCLDNNITASSLFRVRINSNLPSFLFII
ncbi:MAG: hypothetical protein M9958_03145 [Chitinophagales bacterium]|nr:hypothetical protein [Chitinophagales bacterium]